MQQSAELKSCRVRRLSSEKQYSSVNGISKSLTVSQSQVKVMQRYFYRRQCPNQPRIELLKIKKMRSDKNNSFHNNSSSSVKNTITHQDEYSKQCEIMIELPRFNLQKSQQSLLQLPQIKSQKIKIVQDKQLPIPVTPKVYNVTRRASDWAVVCHKNSHVFSKSKNSSQLKQSKTKIQSKIQPKIIKQKRPGFSSNIDIMIKKHKAGNVKQIQQKLRSAASRVGSSQFPRLVTMKQFNRKCGYNQNTKIYIWNSQDEHIRRILDKWGWIQNHTLQSPFFHLKWVYTPNFVESRITQKQLINHFKNTHQITSKSYLTKNLKINQSSFGKIDNYYPKCFDVGNTSQWLTFVDQFNQNIMLILLKKLYNLFTQKCPQKMRKYDLFYAYIFKNDPYCSQQDIKFRKKSILRNKGFRQIDMQNYRKMRSDFIVHINLTVQVLKYWRNYRKQKEQDQDKDYHFLQFNDKTFNQNFYYLKTYSQFINIGQPNSQSNFTKQLFSTPSQVMLQRVSKQYQFCKGINLLFPTYGENSIWIVKPTSTSRGNGIYLTTDLNQIQSSSKGIQSRLVQKYIQKPLIIKNKRWESIYKRKFDLRQWVLLKSIQPLQIYMFSQCYLRLCFDKYNQRQINELFKHLTNYSINKQKFKNKQQSVLPLSYLRQVLMKQYNVSWDDIIKPQIKQIIVKSIKSCLQNLDDCGNNCFQLFGYDILIDQEMKAWLIEINMSPACQQRTPWLSEYLNDMGSGLLKLILPEQMLPSNLQNQVQKTKYNWELILKQQANFNRKKDVQPYLQVTGEAIRLTQQRNVDKFVLQNKMAIKIQRFFKKCVPKYVQYKNNRKNNQKIIEKYAKNWFQISKYKNLRQKYQIQRLQNYFKSFTQYTKKQTKLKNQKIKLKNQKIKIIQNYLKSLCVVNQHEIKVNEYKKQVLISLARTLIAKRQVQNFHKQFMWANQLTKKIQVKCRQYLSNKKQRRRQFQKYFKTLLSVPQFQIKKQQNLQKNNIQIISCYLKSIWINKQCEFKIVKNKRQTISKYMRNLFGRSEYYQKRLEIFTYIVGRVQRVTKKRTRCGYFKIILQRWKKQKQRQIQIEKLFELNKLKKLIAMSKQKNKSLEYTQKIFKIGTNKPNKK